MYIRIKISRGLTIDEWLNARNMHIAKLLDTQSLQSLQRPSRDKCRKSIHLRAIAERPLHRPGGNMREKSSNRFTMQTLRNIEKQILRPAAETRIKNGIFGAQNPNRSLPISSLAPVDWSRASKLNQFLLRQ